MRDGPGYDEEASRPVQGTPCSCVGGHTGDESARCGTDASAGLQHGAAADAPRQTPAGARNGDTCEGKSAGLPAAAASAWGAAQPAPGTPPCRKQRLPGDTDPRQAAMAPSAHANGVHAATERSDGRGKERRAGAAGARGPGSPLVAAARTWGSAEGGDPATRGACGAGPPKEQPSSQAEHRNGYADSSSKKRAGRAVWALSCCCGRRGDDPAARPLHADASAPCARVIFICGLSARGRTEFYQVRAVSGQAGAFFFSLGCLDNA